jgi:hypothetical protein
VIHLAAGALIYPVASLMHRWTAPSCQLPTPDCRRRVRGSGRSVARGNRELFTPGDRRRRAQHRSIGELVVSRGRGWAIGHQERKSRMLCRGYVGNGPVPAACASSQNPPPYG